MLKTTFTIVASAVAVSAGGSTFPEVPGGFPVVPGGSTFPEVPGGFPVVPGGSTPPDGPAACTATEMESLKTIMSCGSDISCITALYSKLSPTCQASLKPMGGGDNTGGGGGSTFPVGPGGSTPPVGPDMDNIKCISGALNKFIKDGNECKVIKDEAGGDGNSVYKKMEGMKNQMDLILSMMDDQTMPGGRRRQLLDRAGIAPQRSDSDNGEEMPGIGGIMQSVMNMDATVVHQMCKPDGCIADIASLMMGMFKCVPKAMQGNAMQEVAGNSKMLRAMKYQLETVCTKNAQGHYCGQLLAEIMPGDDDKMEEPVFVKGSRECKIVKDKMGCCLGDIKNVVEMMGDEDMGSDEGGEENKSDSEEFNDDITACGVDVLKISQCARDGETRTVIKTTLDITGLDFDNMTLADKEAVVENIKDQLEKTGLGATEVAVVIEEGDDGKTSVVVTVDPFEQTTAATVGDDLFKNLAGLNMTSLDNVLSTDAKADGVLAVSDLKDPEQIEQKGLPSLDMDDLDDVKPGVSTAAKGAAYAFGSLAAVGALFLY